MPQSLYPWPRCPCWTAITERFLNKPAHIAFYGSLMHGCGRLLHELGAEHRLRYCGPCLIPGCLLDLGPYPGLIAGEGRVRAELFALADAAVLQLLDEYEDAGPGHPAPEYARRVLHLLTPALDAWVYCYLGDPRRHTRIASGDWLAYFIKE